MIKKIQNYMNGFTDITVFIVILSYWTNVLENSLQLVIKLMVTPNLSMFLLGKSFIHFFVVSMLLFYFYQRKNYTAFKVSYIIIYNLFITMSFITSNGFSLVYFANFVLAILISGIVLGYRFSFFNMLYAILISILAFFMERKALMPIGYHTVPSPYFNYFEALMLVINAFVIQMSVVYTLKRNIRIIKSELTEKEKYIALNNAVLEASQDSIIVVDLSEQVLSYNQNFLECFNVCSKSNPIQGEMVQINPSVTYQQFRDCFDSLPIPKTDLTNANQNYQTIKTKDGRDMEVLFRPVFIHNKHYGYVWTIRDVTHKVKLMNDIVTSETRWKFALEGNGEGVWDWNATTKTLFISNQSKIILGYQPNEEVDIGNDWRKFLDLEVPEKLSDIVTKQIMSSEEASFSTETQIIDKNQTLIWVILRGMVLEWTQQHQPERIIGTIMEITQKKQLEDELVHAKEEAERSYQVKSQFIADISHEIRTPLFAMIGLIKLLGKTELTEKQKRYIDSLSYSSDSMISLVNNILDASKLNTGNFVIDNELFDIREKIYELICSIYPRNIEKKIELIYELSPQLPDFVIGDWQRIQQVISNLYSNAMKFTPKGEFVLRFGVDSINGNLATLHFSISDTGIGISRDKHQSIFQEYTQANDKISKQYGGTGLGLSICKKLVNLMGGDIWVESEIGKGSIFHFTILVQGMNGFKSLKSEVPQHGIYNRIVLLDGNITQMKVLEKVLSEIGINVVTLNYTDLTLMQIIEKIDKLKLTKVDLLIVNETFDREDVFEIFKYFDKNNLDIRTMVLTYDLKKIPSLCKDTVVLAKPVLYRDLLEIIRFGNMKTTSNIMETNQFTHPMNKKIGEILVEDKLIDIHDLQSALNRQYQQNKKVESSIQNQRIHILIAEDNEVNQLILAAMFEKQGFSIDIADNGEKAVEMFKENRYCAILMDIQMPRMDGLEATIKIREIENRRGMGEHIKIIGLTANAMEKHEKLSIKAGMDRFLLKPFAENDLFAMLHECIQPINSTKETVGDGEEYNPLFLWEWVGNEPESFSEIIQKLSISSMQLIGEMRAALMNGNKNQLLRAVHSISGAFYIMNAMNEAHLCEKIISLIQANQLEEIEICLENLESKVGRIIHTMEKYLRGRVQ